MMDTDWTDEKGRVIVEPEKVIPPAVVMVQDHLSVPDLDDDGNQKLTRKLSPHT